MFKTHNVMSDPEDTILMENVESLMAKQQVGYPGGITPQQYAYAEEVTRQNFYLKAVPRVPRVVQYIFEADLDTDQKAAGLEYGLKNLLIYDANFLVSLMTYLAQPNMNPNGIAAVGAFMVKIINEYAEKGEYGVACAYATILILITYAAILIMNTVLKYFGTSKRIKGEVK